MAIAAVVHRTVARFRFPWRIPGIPKFAARPDSKIAAAGPRFVEGLRRIRKLSTGPLLLVGGLVLARLAHEASRSDALWEWENNHTPAPLLWKRTLQSYGFVPASQTEKGRR